MKSSTGIIIGTDRAGESSARPVPFSLARAKFSHASLGMMVRRPALNLGQPCRKNRRYGPLTATPRQKDK